MRVGIIGNGIVGTAIAATLAKHRPSVEVILIDDGRPHKTSEAGQGYLFSIHRFDDPVGLETSVMAKRAWRDLLLCGEGEEEENDNNDDHHEPLLRKTGSLLIAPHRDTELLRDYYRRARDSPHLPGLEYLPDAVERNELLKPGTFRGLFFPGDCTCNPPKLIDRLQTRFGLVTDHRTVTDLRAELRSVDAADSLGGEEEEDEEEGDDDHDDSNARLFDCVICCAGPWINELEDVGVEPVRGLLLETAVGDDCCDSSSSKGSEPVPVMEYGYGTEGIHFTLSSRGGALLVGASREGVGFSTSDLEDLEEAILKHANRFVVEGAIGPVARRRLGFRPACNTDDIGARSSTERKRNYRIHTSAIDERIILVYGFEGQGVLYAPLAAMDVVNDYFST